MSLVSFDSKHQATRTIFLRFKVLSIAEIQVILWKWRIELIWYVHLSRQFAIVQWCCLKLIAILHKQRQWIQIIKKLVEKDDANNKFVGVTRSFNNGKVKILLRKYGTTNSKVGKCFNVIIYNLVHNLLRLVIILQCSQKMTVFTV